jgi:hypothetical protein
MNINLIKKIIIGTLFSINLIIAYWIGLINYLLGIFMIPLLFLLNFLILWFFKDVSNKFLNKKLIIWAMLAINLLFAFVMGSSIPVMESTSKYNMGYVMIPLLVILNYIIFDRLFYYVKHAGEKGGDKTNKEG